MSAGQSGAKRALKRVLVVEDNSPLRAAIARHLTSRGSRVLEASTVSEAAALLAPVPDLLIADVRLPDGPSLGLIEQASQLWPKPLVVAMSGQASAEEAFNLAKLGVREYLAKPLRMADLDRAIERAQRADPDIDVAISALVGRASLPDVQRRLRSVMLRQALALTEGSRSGAARLLRVSRQAIQHILKSGRPSKPAEKADTPADTKVQDTLHGDGPSVRD